MATYSIIGGDQKQYGSVTEEQLRQWIADGRANAQTRAQVEGSAGWKALSEFPEFQAALQGAAPPSLPPIAPIAASVAPPKMSGLAVSSLVLGILSAFTCGITALFGLILGIIALVKVKNSGGRLKGHGLALAGTIVSGIFLVLIPIIAALVLPALATAIPRSLEIRCINNEKQLALAMIIYSSGHTNHFPAAANWCDTIGASPQVLKCPAADSTNRCDYAFNSKLDGLELGKVNPQTVMIFESDAGWNASGGSELLPAKSRHLRKFYVVAFVDGHVEAVTQSRLATLRWDP